MQTDIISVTTVNKNISWKVQETTTCDDWLSLPVQKSPSTKVSLYKSLPLQKSPSTKVSLYKCQR